MKYDVEIPRASLTTMLHVLLVLLGLVGLGTLGYYNTPVGEDGKAHLLSPRLMELSAYQKNALQWAAEMQEIHSGLNTLLEDETIDLLSQEGQASSLYGRSLNLQAEIDGTTPPPTLEVLHAAMQRSVEQFILAAFHTVNWISEPTTENHRSAIDQLEVASLALGRVFDNPWMQAEP